VINRYCRDTLKRLSGVSPAAVRTDGRVCFGHDSWHKWTSGQGRETVNFGGQKSRSHEAEGGGIILDHFRQIRLSSCSFELELSSD